MNPRTRLTSDEQREKFNKMNMETIFSKTLLKQ